jgi:trimeric autotransporter adhesin
MKKTKKALASFAIAGMALTIVPFNAFATGTVPTRLAGTTAGQTAAAIADQTGWTGTAILASSTSYGMVDALTAGPLASYLKAPILLTGAGSSLDADTKAELTKLSVKTVYVTSGTAVIKQSVLDELSGMGITVVPLGGVDRAETSVNIAKKMTGVTKVAVANGIPDALSIASIASAANEPILLTDKNAVPASVAAYLAANSGITASDVIGGTGIISDAVKAQFPGATRHAGTTAYDTNSQVIQDFASALQFSNVFVANGETRIDALAGAPLAAQTKSPIVLTNGTVPSVASYVHGKLADGAVVTALGGAAVVSETVRNGVATGQVSAPTGALSVTSVSAVAADSFKVVFNQAPADTSKVTFAVQNLSTPVTVTATWNSAKTEATLQNSANLPEGSYTVNVKNDTTDLGTTTVKIDQQKIASINITSTKLGVVTNSKDNTQKGYATYNVLDQYGNDITNGGLASSLNFQSGVGTVEASKGLLTLTPNVTNLMQFSTVVITGYDSTSGVSVSSTLTTSTQIGTLSDFQFGTLTNADGKVLTDGDSSVFYASYTAKDISGNATTNFDLIKGGLITHTGSDGTENELTTSNSYVTATVEEDPSDSTKAVIKVVVSGNADLSMDMPTIITAMTWSGTTSTLNTTLHKASKIDTFTLMAPSESIAINEAKVIPFRALDQNGKVLTQFSDIVTTDLTVTNAYWTKNADGTASLICGKNDGLGFATDGQQVITATTTTGKYSSITINIQKAVKADTLQMDTTTLLSNMQSGAIQGVDFGWNYGGLSVKDQYGRVLDMQGKNSGGLNSDASPLYKYAVAVTTSGSISVLPQTPGEATAAEGGTGLQTLADGTTPLIYGAYGTRIQAQSGLQDNGGSGTVMFKLINLDEKWTSAGNDADGTAHVVGQVKTKLADFTVVDSKSVTISVLKNNDIKDYTVDAVSKPAFADLDKGTSSVTTSAAIANNASGAVTDRQNAFAANPFVYGKSSSGSKVVLASGSIIGANVDSSDFVATYPGPGAFAEPYEWQNVAVYANKLGDNVTSSSTTLNVTIKGADGLVHSVTTPIKSSTDTPAATGIYASVKNWATGVSLNDLGDHAKVNLSYFQSGNAMLLERMNSAGSAANRGPVYIYTKDQYGTKAAPLAQLLATITKKGATTPVDLPLTDGTITATQQGTFAVGDVIHLTGVSSNGLVKTIDIEIQ